MRDEEVVQDASVEEITEPEGALVDIRKMPVGGPSMAILELWTAESQRTTPYYSSPSMRRSSARPASASAGRMPVWGDPMGRCGQGVVVVVVSSSSSSSSSSK